MILTGECFLKGEKSGATVYSQYSKSQNLEELEESKIINNCQFTDTIFFNPLVYHIWVLLPVQSRLLVFLFLSQTF